MTDTPGKDSTPNQRPEEGNAPGLVSDHDVVGESIRRRYASSPGLIDLAAPHKLINRLYEFGRQRVPLLNRVLARWAVGTGNRISYSPLPLFWRLYQPHTSELPAGYEPATLTGQTSRSRPVPTLQPRQLSPGAAGRGDRAALQPKGEERERPLADVGRHAVSEDPVRVAPKPVDSGRGEELPWSDPSQAASVLSLTRDAFVASQGESLKRAPGPRLATPTRPFETLREITAWPGIGTRP